VTSAFAGVAEEQQIATIFSLDKPVDLMYRKKVFGKPSWLFLAFHRPSLVFYFPAFSF